MPVRSLNSSVLRWPDRDTVDAAARAWAAQVAAGRGDVERIGYFGSYARGDWGVGSDLDVVAVVARSELPFERRPVEWRPEQLPVPADLLVYTADEWQAIAATGSRFARVLSQEVVWVFERPPAGVP